MNELGNRRPPGDEIADLSKQIQAAYDEYMAESEQVRKQLETTHPTNPKFPELYDRHKAMADKYAKVREECTAKRDNIFGIRAGALFAEMQSAIDIVAKRKRIDVVLQAYSSEDAIAVAKYEHAVWDIAQRSVLQYPDGSDITDEVLQEILR